MENQDNNSNEINNSIDKLEHRIYDRCKRKQELQASYHSLFEISNLTIDNIIQNKKLWAGMMTQR